MPVPAETETTLATDRRRHRPRREADRWSRWAEAEEWREPVDRVA